MRLTFINSIRALFPVWNFFDRISQPYELWVKVDGHWVKKQSSHRTQLHHLFFNPRGTREHLEHSLLELFAQDIEHCAPGEISKLVSFELISRLAEGRDWRVMRQQRMLHEERP